MSGIILPKHIRGAAPRQDTDPIRRCPECSREVRIRTVEGTQRYARHCSVPPIALDSDGNPDPALPARIADFPECDRSYTPVR